jgi:CBS domain-containing protein
MRVFEIMTRKVATCAESDTLADAARLMAEADCGVIPVVGSAPSQPVGVVTDRDICMAAYRFGKRLTEIRVRDAMTAPVRTCNVDASASEAEYVMRDAGVRRLPVVDDRGTLVGIVSLADLALEAQHERRLSRPTLEEIEIGDTLAVICKPRTPTRT